MRQLRFRRAVPGDAAALAAFMTRTFRDTYSSDHGGDCRPSDVETYIAASFAPDRQRTELADASLTTVVGDVDGEIVAYAQIREGAATPAAPGARPVEIARFYVDRRWHGRGVAAALMARALEAAADGDPIWLGVYKRNARAIAFYAKMGFAIAGEQSFTMGDDTQDDWVLVRVSGAPVAPR